jgi:hypothetical protein
LPPPALSQSMCLPILGLAYLRRVQVPARSRASVLIDKFLSAPVRSRTGDLERGSSSRFFGPPFLVAERSPAWLLCLSERGTFSWPREVAQVAAWGRGRGFFPGEGEGTGSPGGLRRDLHNRDKLTTIRCMATGSRPTTSPPLPSCVLRIAELFFASLSVPPNLPAIITSRLTGRLGLASATLTQPTSCDTSLHFTSHLVKSHQIYYITPQPSI